MVFKLFWCSRQEADQITTIIKASTAFSFVDFGYWTRTLQEE